MIMDIQRTLVVGADHAGYLLKDQLAQAARDAGWTVIDCGTHSSTSCDYPDFAHKACREIEAGHAALGLLVCGTGIGMALAANRHPTIRCAQARDTTEARFARQHNNANVLALGARLTGEQVALDCLTIFLNTAYEGGRHDKRLAKLNLTP